MNAFVEECRREWKRLGVPDLLAEEMATELEADLAEAEADGVSAAEMLGESDPRRFAATWARERGLVSERPPRKSRKGLWITLAVVLAVFIALPALALIGTGSGSGGSASLSKARVVGPPRPDGVVTVPHLVGLTVCKADLTAHDAGLFIHAPNGYPCDAVVVEQRPRAGAVVRRDAQHAVVTLRLRARR
jgi:hypothetical protein